MQYAYRDRRARKGDFRRLWIQRINAAARENGTSYSRFVSGLKQQGSGGRPQGARRPGRHGPRSVQPLSSTVATNRDDWLGVAAPERRQPSDRSQSQPEVDGGRRLLTIRLGLRHQKVQRLRRLLQRRSARLADGVFVSEGVKLLDCALDAGAAVESVYVGAGALVTSRSPGIAWSAPSAAGARASSLLRVCSRGSRTPSPRSRFSRSCEPRRRPSTILRRPTSWSSAWT